MGGDFKNLSAHAIGKIRANQGKALEDNRRQGALTARSCRAIWWIRGKSRKFGAGGLTVRKDQCIPAQLLLIFEEILHFMKGFTSFLLYLPTEANLHRALQRHSLVQSEGRRPCCPVPAMSK